VPALSPEAGLVGVMGVPGQSVDQQPRALERPRPTLDRPRHTLDRSRPPLDQQRRTYLLARVVVARHYGRPLTLAAVAQAVHTSPRALQRAYARFGHSFHEDLLARRMSAAAQLLSEQRAIRVAAVARLVGYGQGASFARAFRRRYGLSPATFRERASQHAGSEVARHAARGRGGGSNGVAQIAARS
jgi:AraC-like DNA-binding protein